MNFILQLLLALGVVTPCVAMAMASGRRTTARRWAWGVVAVALLLGAAWTDPLAVGLAWVDGRLGGFCMTAPVP
ncbi:hypothetical protein SAMN05216359_12420 [Roseateles sp. YR242]|uniref:hypothetical protein n=1 Tax=Roseateles sp. YR242 TaxID=1855305 RepID=UPI0008AD1D4D|nr:hypothetical protein [Roseateles sp. YR242]SEL91152.1 hypothetical protein SAMN05216359_12420 [Roseateles sp. YR242]